MDERSSLVYNDANSRSSQQSSSPELPFSSFTSDNRNLLEVAFVGVVSIMSVITFFVGVFRGVTADEIGGTYFMLGVTHLAFVVLESLLVLFSRNGELEGDKTRFFYTIGCFTILHSLFTNIILFSG